MALNLSNPNLSSEPEDFLFIVFNLSNPNWRSEHISVSQLHVVRSGHSW